MSKNKKQSNIGALPHKGTQPPSPFGKVPPPTMRPEVSAAVAQGDVIETKPLKLHTVQAPTVNFATTEKPTVETTRFPPTVPSIGTTSTAEPAPSPKMSAHIAFHIEGEGIITQGRPYSGNDELNVFMEKVRLEGVVFQHRLKPEATFYFPHSINKVVVTIKQEKPVATQ